ncbi:ribulose 1,5-bisphosphate carboxylase large subunit-like protein [Anaerobacterium chartisolvens]|uniref:Ribulose 1,5-bisphosphate carboxylase large subunit-like protein n=1 Tax=Anaerobacterium chartisolvens TaxID=1297424 RepID=A0A369BD68_9FIRM|nr:RuBisCO large subunit C-terminal-like domain-containing protein [Anaerobacterium chartisolvens]RCX19510.1 ribulose 1,5-bisphosphate carboxylase large subunit-like protein [Anaerobacterium chartisolvens]
MSIVITYNNFILKEEEKIKERMGKFSGDVSIEALRSFARDVSWGTYADELTAIDKTIDGWESVKDFQPSIEPEYLASDKKQFTLTFKDDFFNFESEGVDHFIATIAGDVLTYSYFYKIQVADFCLNSDVYREYFKGPNIGIDRIYKEFLKDTVITDLRPIVAFSIKPRMGLTIDKLKKVCEEVSKGEIDIIEDDERIIDPIYCPFTSRVDIMANLQRSYKTKFSVNITGSIEKMIERLRYAHSKGIKFVKIDVLVTGFDSLRLVSEYIRTKLDSQVAITCYPDAIGMYRHLSREFILKMSRLCGADIIYTGTPQWARMDDEFSKEKYDINIKYLQDRLYTQRLLLDSIEGFSVKDSLPTISNGCDISNAELIQFIYRKAFNHHKFAFYVGGGISGFPATLKESTKEWMNCIKHTANKSLDDYDNYKYRFLEKMLEAGIETFEIKKEMGK